MSLERVKMVSIKRAAPSSFETARRSKIRDIISKLVELHFSATLGREPDIVNLVNAIICKETRFNSTRLGNPVVSDVRGSGGRIYMTSSAIITKLETATSDEKDYINQGLVGVGIMQVMGWNFIRGGSLTGKCEIERLRPDLASQLVVDPGTDLRPLILGEANLEKAILAGLIILEGKYKAVYATPEGFSVRGDPYKRTFFSKMSGAVAAYLGLGKADRNNTTPEAYASEIVGGKFYVMANGPDAIGVSDSKINIASANGPSTNGSNQGKISGTGCTQVKKVVT